MKNLLKKIKIVFILIFSACFYSKNAEAQNLIVKTIVNQNSQLNLNGWAKKIKSIVENNGWIEDWQTQFVLRSDIIIGEKQVVESGMQKFTVCKFVLELELKNWTLNTILHKETFNLTGTGMAIQDAFGQAINKITDKQFKDFFVQSQNKIILYYQKECQNILDNVSKEVDKKNFEKAIMILSAIPSKGVACSQDAELFLEDTYQIYQSHQCKKQLLEAKIAIAAQKYESALQILGQIPSETECERSRDEMIDEIAKKYVIKNEIEKPKSWKATKEKTINQLYQKQIIILEK